MKTRITVLTILLFGSLIIVSGAVQAHGNRHDEHRNGIWNDGTGHENCETPTTCSVVTYRGGGEIPSPFSLNTKFELADGELYSLLGRVLLKEPGHAFFEVDTRFQPWLSHNKASGGNRIYPIKGFTDCWLRYKDTSVRLTFRAKGRIITNEFEMPTYEIFLEVLTEPELME